MTDKRKKHPASSQNIYCFTGEELYRYKFGTLPPPKRKEIFHHLNTEKCRRCLDIFNLLVEKRENELPMPILPERPITPEKRFVLPIAPLHLKQGQIWTTSARVKNHEGKVVHTARIAVPVLIIEPGNKKRQNHNAIRVLPLSDDTEFQFGHDSVVLDETNPLAYAVLAEIFNEQSMLAGNLDRFLGEITGNALKDILKTRKRGSEEQDETPDDQYLEWMKKEIMLTAYLSFPVNAMIWQEDVEEDIEIGKVPEKASMTENRQDICSPVIELVALQWAADSDDQKAVPFWELKATKTYSLSIVQKDEDVFFRYVGPESEAPGELKLDGQFHAFNKVEEKVFEVLLGKRSEMPEDQEIEIMIQGEPFLTKPRYRRPDDKP